MNYFPNMNAASPALWQWTKSAGSRQGEGAAPLLSSNAAYPTRFGRPFRSSAGGTLVPPLPSSVLQLPSQVEATLLRSDSPTANAITMQPLFTFDDSTSGGYTDANNPDRNPYFRYQALQRLGNLATTRSNVYAVWITVGYFEVTPASQLPGYNSSTAAQIYPDGYTLGRELGVDTGEIERHRAFYIFDRTIPVGFQRGQDLNVEKAILVGRFIE